MGNPGGCTNNFPQKGCGLGHVTPKIYGIQSNISSKIHELETSNVVPISATLEIWAGAGISFSKSFSYRHRIWHVAWSFVLGKRSGRTNKFPQNGRGLGHVTPQICGIRTNIFSKVLQLETSNLVKKKAWSWELGKPSGRTKRKCKFMSKLGSSKNLLISAFADDAAGELSLFQGRW